MLVILVPHQHSSHFTLLY